MSEPTLPKHFGDYAVQGFLAEEAGGIGWWQTCTTSALIDLCRIEGFVAAFAGIARVLRSGEDPRWAVGSTDARAAIGVAVEWLHAGINPPDVEPWLLAGCWSPRIARVLSDAGLQPRLLLDANDQPAHWVSVQDGQSVPVALAVIEWELPVAEAIRIVDAWPLMVPADSPSTRPPQQPGGPT